MAVHWGPRWVESRAVLMAVRKGHYSVVSWEHDLAVMTDAQKVAWSVAVRAARSGRRSVGAKAGHSVAQRAVRKAKRWALRRAAKTAPRLVAPMAGQTADLTVWMSAAMRAGC